MKTLTALLITLSFLAHANSEENHDHTDHQNHNSNSMGPNDCNEMEVWDYSMGMCMPLPMNDMPMKMIMVHGNSFFTQNWNSGPRGENAFSVPNMFMIDAGSSIGDRHYLNLNIMATVERWSLPDNGYSLLLQTGEERKDGTPYIDAQHPHSSPIMGLTISDTITLNNGKDHLKFWFAPRGQSTDGPVAFMHRPTGMVNPDAPLGHHIGQDAGHITSTVIGGAIRLSDTTLEVSTFNGEEPKPSKTDLPIGDPNSFAVRLTQQFTPHFYAMGSAAKIEEPHHGLESHLWRYSTSLYNDITFNNGWMLHNTFIWGLINGYNHASSLNSFGEEFWLLKDKHNIWGRIEVLERTPEELDITTSEQHSGQWITAATLGYTQKIAKWESLDVGLGGSLTKYFLPTEFESAYGGDPISGKVFLQISGMKMWEL